MNLSAVVLKIRAQSIARFTNRVTGAAELMIAQKATLKADMLFIVPLSEKVGVNQNPNNVNQTITEQFGVIAAMQNDSLQSDRLGIQAYNLVDTVRGEIFSAILSWQIPGSESLITYAGARFLDINGAYLWYMYMFNTDKRITSDCDGIDIGRDDLADLTTIFSQTILAPDANLPVTTGLPTALAPPELNQLFEADHSYDDGFSNGFDTLTSILNKN